MHLISQVLIELFNNIPVTQCIPSPNSKKNKKNGICVYGLYHHTLPPRPVLFGIYLIRDKSLTAYDSKRMLYHVVNTYRVVKKSSNTTNQ